jgi:RNA polymerase sigma-70 factor, ECF subfamily
MADDASSLKLSADGSPSNVGGGPGDVSEPCAAIDLDLPRLVADHADVLYRYAFRLTGSVADAEDLTQQTFLIAHQKLSQVRDPSGARGWLFAVLRRVYLRSHRKTRQVPLAGTNLDIEAVPDEIIDELIIDREALQTAIDELPDPYKLVLMSYYFEDLSYREIAERFELPVGTVMSRLSRAKSHLRSRLVEPELAVTARHPAGTAGQGGV